MGAPNISIPMKPMQSSSVARPTQSSVMPLQGLATQQFDFTTIMNMMLPLMLMVMMVKMIGGAMSSETA